LFNSLAVENPRAGLVVRGENGANEPRVLVSDWVWGEAIGFDLGGFEGFGVVMHSDIGAERYRERR